MLSTTKLGFTSMHPRLPLTQEDRLCITAMFMHTEKDTMLRSYILAWLPQGY